MAIAVIDPFEIVKIRKEKRKRKITLCSHINFSD